MNQIRKKHLKVKKEYVIMSCDKFKEEGNIAYYK